MNAIILGKERTPIKSETVADYEAQGMMNIARTMRETKKKAFHHFIVGSHHYMIVEWENGKKSKPHKIM